MNTGGEVAGIVASVYADLGKKGIELGSKLLSYILLGMLKGIEGKLNTGQISMKRMLESGDELKQIKINTKDSKAFIAIARKTGLTFALMDKIPNDDMYTLVFKLKDQEIVKSLMSNLTDKSIKQIKEEVKASLIDEYLVNGGKDIFIVDKDNPENYISTEIERFEVNKGYFVNTKNPDDYIAFNENIKERTLSVEIHSNGEITSYDTSNFEYNDVKNKISTETEKWDGIELLYSEEERIKYKNKQKEEKINKEEHGDKKTMQEVEKEVKNIRNSQPRKDNKDKVKSPKEKGR